MAAAQAYHCLCTTFILATNYDLAALPTRAEPALDQAKILPVSAEHTIFQHIIEEQQQLVVRRGDGFEKRTLLKCNRCDLVVAYKLDQAHFVEGDIKAEEVVFILPGALTSTENMKIGQTPAAPPWAL